MNNKTFESIFNVFAITFSLSQIETFIGILILIVNLLMLLYNSILKIINHFKNKNFQAIENDLKNLNKDLDNMINDIKKGDDNK